jgi:hypothetical protein
VAVPAGYELAGPAGVAVAVLVSISVSSLVMAWQLARRAHASYGGLVAPLALSAVAGVAALLLQDLASLPLRLGLAAVAIVGAGFMIRSHIKPARGSSRTEDPGLA